MIIYMKGRCESVKKINNIEELRGVRCDVLGMGKSNLPLIDILIAAGASVTVRDKKTRDAFGGLCEAFEQKGVSFILGEHYLDGIDTEVIFRSPGIRPDAGSIPVAVKNGALLSSEMELFVSLTKADILAITGSDGKTTTTTLTHLFMKAMCERYERGHAYVGGNIGTPLLSKCAEMSAKDTAVIELSSFQLMTMDFCPLRAAITNITPNHLNWHTDMEEYIAAKCRLADGAGLLVLNADNSVTADIARERGKDMLLFSSNKSSYADIVSPSMKNTAAVFARDNDIIYSDGNTEVLLLRISDIKLPGKHNIENYMTAMALTYGLVDTDIYTEIARSFGGVEHRLELVRELDGVKYYNSSIDSTPTRTAAALGAVSGSKVVICGGYDKNISFEPLADALCENARCAVLTGATAKKIKDAILSCEKYSPESLCIIERADFAEAVSAAHDAAYEGESVILSPACASFDAFADFEERGRFFKKLVNKF